MATKTNTQYKHYSGLSKDRLYRILYRHVTSGAGYQMFGMDWPTLKVCYPQIASTMRACLRPSSNDPFIPIN